MRLSSRALEAVFGFRRALCEEYVHLSWIVFVIVLALWLLCFSFHIAGGLTCLWMVVASTRSL
jgi:hypothetical protein